MRLVFASLALALTSCAAATSTTSEQLVLKAYDVPAEHAAELQSVLSNMLYTAKDQPPKGRAALSPSGQLLVSAPASFQPGIAEVVSRLKSAPAPRAPTVTLDYWVVVGTPSTSATPGAGVSREIGDVVDALQKNQGPMKMAMLERVRLSSQSGSDAMATSPLFDVHETAALHSDKVLANVKLQGIRGFGLLETRVEIPLGQTVVLGQAGIDMKHAPESLDADLAKATENGTAAAFYIVRASVDAK
jgi:hypothetical protein